MKLFKNTKDYYIIKKSNLFDSEWFGSNYDLPDDINFIKYYLKYGVEKNLNPSREFDTAWYLMEYPDVKNSGMHPFVHYIRHGIKEHRLSRPLFQQNKDKFSLENQEYDPCFFRKNLDNIDEKDVNVAIFIKNDINNLLPTEYIRIVIPFYHLFLEKNFTPYIIHNEDIKCFSENFSKMDVIIVQRDSISENTAKILVEICKNNNIKLIYEIDDDLLGIDKNHPNYNEFIGKKEVIKYLIKNSDLVTVSTISLKEKLCSFNSNIKVIKNYSNDLLALNNNSFNSDIIKIGYMGTVTHKHDVKLIEKAIENVKKYFLKKGKKIIFETVGVSDEKISYANQINIPFKYSKYPYFIRWLKRVINWDIALAPLENSEINKSKSEIKYLEYGSLGIPGIYSDIGAYSEIIENYKNGILIENNSVEEWQSAIIGLIEDEELQKDIANNAKKDIENNYSIKLMVNSWCNLFEELLTKEKLHIFNKCPLKLLVNPFFNKEYMDVVESGLWYELEYPIAHQDTIYHFLSKGVFEGYNPFIEFNTLDYIEKNNIDIIKTNPLVHFIRKYNRKFKYNHLNSNNIEDISQNLENKVSIIVPIYNAYDDVKKCIESVLKYSTIDFELILINDKSTDVRIDKLLEYYQKNPNVNVINNSVNKGFVASINIGLKNSNHDVILLNSDTIASPNWIQKLTIAAFSNEKIATVTPFSNSAGVFSVPLGNPNNLIPENLGINGVSNIVEKVSNHVYLRVPTGNGFCMFIKRKAIDTIGYFDEKTFGRGYGEENDFCMRAIENDMLNIIDDSTFIFHNEGSSFGEEKQMLIDKNIRLLEQKHPDYGNKVHKFINSDEFKDMKYIISDGIKNHSFCKKRVLYVGSFINLKSDENENFLLTAHNHLKLYYFDNELFKVKEFPANSIDEICFNVLINLGIDELVIENHDLNLEKSKNLMDFLMKETKYWS